MTHVGALALISWDPFIRGVVILALFIVLLPGSVYLVLSTNTGARLGFLLGAAGLVGMIALLSIFWVVLNSTADIGRVNSWKPLEVITGDYASQVTIKGVQDFPSGNLKAAQPAVNPLPSKHWYWPFQSCPANKGWYNLSTSRQTDAESAADKVLAPTAVGGVVPARLTTPFSANTDYVYLGAYEEKPNSGCIVQAGLLRHLGPRPRVTARAPGHHRRLVADHLRHHLLCAPRAGQGDLGPPGRGEAGGGRSRTTEGKGLRMSQATASGV
jgi:hypothetical protein